MSKLAIGGPPEYYELFTGLLTELTHLELVIHLITGRPKKTHFQNWRVDLRSRASSGQKQLNGPARMIYMIFIQCINEIQDSDK